jgi:hypothetical protein
MVRWIEPLLPIDADPPAAVDVARAWVLARECPAGRWEWSASETGPAAEHPLAVRTASAAPGAVGVALWFAEYLFALRRERNLIPGPVVLAAARPLPTPDSCRIPHLTTVIDHTGRTSDHVVWEHLSTERTVAWLGGAPQPDWEWLFASLEPLLALRARARCGQLDATPDHQELARLIADRFLSIRAVCLNPGLFHRLLST